MKRLMVILVLVLLLSACSPAPSASAQGGQSDTAPVSAAAAQAVTPTPASAIADVITIDFEDAANLRNQLAFGTLKLAGSGQAVTPEQARALLPLWQAMAALSGESTTVSEELNAVQNQIIETMQPQQVQAIAALRITNSMLSAFYEEKGIVLPTPIPGVTRVPGAMKDLPEEARQATQAARAASGTTGSGTGQITKTLLYDEAIKMLTDLAAQ